MHRSFWTRISNIALLGAGLLALTAGGTPGLAMPSRASAPAIQGEYCRQGRPVRKLSVLFRRASPANIPGIPLDQALRHQQAMLENLREEARFYFLIHANTEFSKVLAEYTILLPEQLRERYGIGADIGMSDVSASLKYRRLFWKQYFERFARIDEAPDRDPGFIRFQVAVDLTVFCQYGRKTADLVSH